MPLSAAEAMALVECGPETRRWEALKSLINGLAVRVWYTHGYKHLPSTIELTQKAVYIMGVPHTEA
jgi:hypothetical protein